ncbi:MT-A70-domain-containing protein [Rhodocollybia butyracea]|uniref:mRNA m(6)A methyltransferase n=1 Tax=Rhodocollybia butyracea TaxID=206335 RepID=A0A9P5UFU5_9AGAR|nr:MT-A70-domain-containing protein [Rhodocollybia butyracea]
MNELPTVDEALKVSASISLLSLVNSGSVSTPISSKTLLTRVITSKPSSASQLPRFRLTDLPKFELILESLAYKWPADEAVLSLVREEGQLVVMDVVLANGLSTTASGLDFNPRNPKKRKRIIDEEADSAAGSEPEEEDEKDEKTIQEIGRFKQSGLAGFSKQQREVYKLVQSGTAKGKLLAEEFTSDVPFEPICSHITKEECSKSRRLEGLPGNICDRVHFRPVLRAHTDASLGHCSYLNTCYSEPTYAQSPSIPPFPNNSTQSPYGASLPPGARGPSSLPSGLGAGGRGKEKAPCRYLHYEVDWDGGDGAQAIYKTSSKHHNTPKLGIGLGPTGKPIELLPPQWINCDLRRFDYSVLGKFHVIMADPPWDIHMSLPYGTLTDDEMRAMPIPALQDEGLLFLWVTGRAMEVGRECLRVWGYTRIDEVIWLKTNQLQRVIRTGRTGHWLNHTKEHMLVGVKTQYRVNPDTGENEPIDPPVIPKWVNRGLDTDVIVSEVRETSRKPEEVYGLIERMCPGGRKVEIFGRKHNVRPGWLTLGNQLGPDQIYEEELVKRVKAKYPERPVVVPSI